MSNIYLTTAIPYINGHPHVGHALDYLFADITARYYRLQHHHVRLQAGTDEHGNKIFQKAKDLNLDPKTYADQSSALFQDFIKLLNISYTDFIRTTDPEHIERCQKIWQQLSPHIYLGHYSGWYCSGCENFVSEKEYTEHQGICPDHQRSYTRLEEENFYLRLSDFKPQIKQAILDQTLTILPDYRAKDILRLLEDAPDISISRPQKQLSWGIPVPNHPDQIMYVWVDALSNYLTVLGYPDQDIADFWPPKIQFVGKDILRFHAIIWPALLLALDLPLPQIIHSHGHILSSGKKMSKSLGNIVDPIVIISRHQIDAFRYFFTRHIDTFADSDFTLEKFDASYNNELANDLGNLVQRLATLCVKNQVPGPIPFDQTFDPDFVTQMEQLNFSRAIDYLWQQIQELNRLIDQKQPWTVAKTDPDQAKSILLDITSRLLNINYQLQPFLPDSTVKISAIFSNSTITPTAPLFPKK